MKSYSPYQFSIFRIILGIYLLFHFVALVPYAAEIWSNVGLLPDASVNLTYGIFPNILYYLSSATGVTLYVGVLAILSFCFLIGFQRPIISILLWYAWASLFDRNNLINNPGIPYVGWLLLVCAVLPKGEPWSVSSGKKDKKWEMPTILYYGAWILMAVGYTISGFDKFSSPSWRDGTAIFHLLENPLARDYWLRDLLVQLPVGILKIKTWSVLFIEMAFLPLALFKPTRKWIWLAMILMHLGILLIVDFADLTLGILMIHWFTFDSNWLKPKPKKTGILFFDGVCSVCNGLIDFMMLEDRNIALQFASLQGSTAKNLLDKKYIEDLNSIVYIEGDKIYTESTGVLQAVSSMGGIYKLLLILKLVPKFLRDKIYAYIAANRYKWFGKKDNCRMPTPEERDRLLP
jgi:predicted DCC family thiol-disulfide oxidoreductase YuxK